jgi:hypothetical protein
VYSGRPAAVLPVASRIEQPFALAVKKFQMRVSNQESKSVYIEVSM